jgi:geranylgeranyl reductase family protein
MNILDREKYDKHLVDEAVKAGATIQVDAWVHTRTPRNEVRMKTPEGEMTLTARVVIGADGPVSVISRSLGNLYAKPERDLSLSMQHHMSSISIDKQSVEMLFGGEVAPGGYGWVIPLSETEARVGLGLRRFIARARYPLRRYLDNILQTYPSLAGNLSHAQILSSVSALIPMSGPVDRTASNNCVLVGDAAGLVMATNGGGIPTALASGSIAGNVVSAHLSKGISLLDYERHLRYEMGTELETAKVSLRIADLFMQSDSITELGMRILGSRFLEPVIRCRMPLPNIFSRALISGMRSLI